MPIYDIQTPDGKIISIEGARQPSMDEIKSAYANYKKVNLKPLTEEQKAKPSGDYSKGVPLAALTGTLEGLASGLESYANGYTFGGYDWLNRQFGRNPQDLRNEIQQRAESVGLGGVNTTGQIASGLGGGLRGLSKLTGAAGEKLLGSRAWGLPAMGLSGGLDAMVQSNFDNNFSNPMQTAIDTAEGAGLGALLGGTVKLGTNYLSPNAMTKGLKGGLDNVANNPKALKIANEAIRKNDDIAQLYLDTLPDAVDNVNYDSSQLINKALTRKINVPKTIDSQKRKYGKFMEEHGQDQLLNPKSAKQQAKENFNKWFKGSQIVDEAGEPLTLYHGTPNADVDYLKEGTYLTPNKEYADVYQGQGASSLSYKNEARKPGTYEVYVDMKKPFDTRNPQAREDFYKYYYQKMGTGTDLMEDGLPDWNEGRDLYDFITEYHPELGYDGIVLNEGAVGGYGDAVKSRGISYVTTKPEQVKSVKNSGGWSKSPSLTDPDWVAEPSVADLFDGLNGFQKKSLASAIKQGSERTNSKLGSLESLNEAKKKLNDMITQAYKDGNKSDVLHLEGIKNRLDNTLGKGLKGRDRPYAKALQMEEAYEMGLQHNPNNVMKREYLEDLSLLDKNAFAQGLMDRVTYNPLTSKNLSKKALDYSNTFKKVLPTESYNTLKRGLNKNSVLYERLANVGARAENKLRIPEGSRLFLREQLEETTPKKIGLPLVGAALDELIYQGHKKALNTAAKNLLDPTFEGVKDAWVLEGYPTLNAYISGALANE